MDATIGSTGLQRHRVEDDLNQLGWCTHQVRRLQQVYSPAALSFLSSIDRRGYRQSNHDACVDAPRCVANNVNLQSYNTAHAPLCSTSCAPISVDYSAIVSIIQNGGVPLVSIHTDPASTPEEPILHLRVTPRTLKSRYTALSHVWFDGLGNPSANALPSCQIQRMQAQLTSQPRDFESGAVQMGPLEVDWSRQNFMLHPER
ncbi:hypothetical protein GQ44DRAFT_724868 [Phaeosphaeriaceae sp. PMI808]|nr:hypothetical protein GQ44DRAFT_724868 [Phaeosphaeriaceae sp. PMI808]